MPAGAIDSEELQGALERMGIHKGAAEVEELMEGVDEGGSGELAQAAACCHTVPSKVQKLVAAAERVVQASCKAGQSPERR
jgi:hypothetical protein